MIIVDTNVISEPLRRTPDARVVSWLDAQAIETLYLTTITVAELRFGVAVLPDGARQRRLAARIEGEVLPLFAGRILSFGEPATIPYVSLRTQARRRGLALGDLDALIAAIALDTGYAVATRDASPFQAAKVTVIDPFKHLET